MFKNNVFIRSYKEKKKWDYSERIACQTAPAMVIEPIKISYWRFLIKNIKSYVRSKR